MNVSLVLFFEHQAHIHPRPAPPRRTAGRDQAARPPSGGHAVPAIGLRHGKEAKSGSAQPVRAAGEARVRAV